MSDDKKLDLYFYKIFLYASPISLPLSYLYN